MSEYITFYDDDHPIMDGPDVLGIKMRVKEEIVRCRDCVHIHTVRSWTGADVDECWLHASRETGAFGKVRTEPDGYCAWGERRDK